MRNWFGFIMLFLSVPAFADNCPLLDEAARGSVWENAERILKQSLNGEFIYHCATCTALPDAVPVRKILKVSDYSWKPGKFSKPSSPAYMTVNISGEEQDISSVYVRTSSRIFTNLALLVGCPAIRTPPLVVSDGGRPPVAIEWDELDRNGRNPASAPKHKAPTRH